MNKGRLNEINDVITSLNDIISKIDDIKGEEEEAGENMVGEEAKQRSEDAVSNLDSANEQLDTAKKCAGRSEVLPRINRVTGWWSRRHDQKVSFCPLPSLQPKQ